ncbi:MAG: hypothetical protein IT361_13390 [Gemmatimonadaceae bacterium]|nr:hypothetical protein [Gemmatimonadaceae bacterium]
MWALIKAILVKLALIKTLLRILASLGWLLPLALLLKAIGIPLLILFALLALPVIIVLAVIGLPLLLVVVVGGGLVTFAIWVASMGLLALKLALPILAVVWLISWLRRRNDDGPATAADTGTA